LLRRRRRSRTILPAAVLLLRRRGTRSRHTATAMPLKIVQAQIGIGLHLFELLVQHIDLMILCLDLAGQGADLVLKLLKAQFGLTRAFGLSNGRAAKGQRAQQEH
jgi:hypothetical protein